MTVKWSDLAVGHPSKARDAWAHKDIKLEGDEYAADVPSHGVALLTVR